MSDAEGIRNWLGPGWCSWLVVAITAVVAFVWLMAINWRLTSVTAVLLIGFGGGMAFAFTKLRPIFRQRGKLNAEVTGRLVEGSPASGSKAYTAERREQHAFAKGASSSSAMLRRP